MEFEHDILTASGLTNAQLIHPTILLIIAVHLIYVVVCVTKKGTKKNIERQSPEYTRFNQAFCLGSDYIIIENMYSSLTVQSAIIDPTFEPIIIHNEFKRKKDFTKMNLSRDAQTIMNLPNSGGTSIHSEALSCDVLGTMLNAKLKATELELQYCPGLSKDFRTVQMKITDYSISINNNIFGVSVTRAMKHKGIFNREDANRLLTKKLYGVNISSQTVVNKYKWKKQILHIWAQHKYIRDILNNVYNELPCELKNNTIVIITVCENAPWVFYDRLFEQYS